MSDALLTRIAEALEALVTHAKADIKKVETEVEAVAEKVKGKKQKAAETTSAPVAAATAALTATPAASVSVASPAQPAAAPAAAPSEQLVSATANAVIDLANNYSRDAAIACMAKYGAQKVSQVKPGDMAALLADVTAAIAAEKSKKANESLV